MKQQLSRWESSNGSKPPVVGPGGAATFTGENPPDAAIIIYYQKSRCDVRRICRVSTASGSRDVGTPSPASEDECATRLCIRA
jgi:hypothetical protein